MTDSDEPVNKLKTTVVRRKMQMFNLPPAANENMALWLVVNIPNEQRLAMKT